ncbi:hypothetical protein AUJ10_00420 [Candidatus Pacearchaeota archaeon CG1_02_31_27]|nr:MAG: hypothetical protein AUJ10_00420 [Candidatus Pacearchaeota archaeon CG1_02_31_27]
MNFFDLIEPNVFSLEIYLFLHFTILGVFVTLVALTTTLTKEVRQDLIWKYYLKTPFVISYYCTIVISFVITLIVYLFNKTNFSGFIFFISALIFFYTISFIPVFLFRLKREWLYNQISKELKNEIEEKE